MLLIALALAGCGEQYDHEPVFPVSGSLFVAGKPAAGAMVTFHPADRASDPRALRSFATVDAAGKFQLTTYFPADGVPAGDYVVTLNWPAELPPGTHPTVLPRDRLGRRFSSPAKPYTRLTVEEQPYELEPFHIAK
jgi:hypothetical protein